MAKHYIKKALSYSAVGGLGFTIVAGLQGCSGEVTEPPAGAQDQQQESIAEAAQQGVFMVIRQTGTNPDTYELRDKYPSSEGTRAILQTLDGKERILSEAELKELAEAEAQRVEAGDSQLAQPVAENQGLSLGETVLAAAAGALIGGMLANRLMSNSNFQQHQQRTNQRARSAVSSTRNPAQGSNSTSRSGSQPRSGFFGGSQGTSGRGSGSFGS